MIAGLWFSSRPEELMRPPWALPVEYSEAKKQMQRNACRLLSIRFCIGFQGRKLSGAALSHDSWRFGRV
ncbi:MAG: hypothetical protein CVU30_06650 [Betaproteobacteria bacterium HGW-Betaproteobacteria-3]|nr:MAG: hypothetical protein CVU30_06650 [Betaproteobacteria bacterium HGW-Betaproteobacteria-3]